jgi:hypothetical protein
VCASLSPQRAFEDGCTLVMGAGNELLATLRSNTVAFAVPPIQSEILPHLHVFFT